MALTPLRVDIISDVMCPWCLIGWLKFQKVIEHFEDQIAFEIHWRAFELNPDMPEEGVDAAEYMSKRYQLSAEKSRENRSRIAQTATELGFPIEWGTGFRLRNSYRAHRLLKWAEAVDEAGDGPKGDRQTQLKMELFKSHFQHGEDVNDVETLAVVAGRAGLDAGKAAQIARGDTYGDVVRAEEAMWQENGIFGVPTFLLNERMLISGAQEPEYFMRVIERKILG